MSSTYIANLVPVLAFVLPVFGLHVVDPESLANALLQVVGAFATLYVFYGRYKAGGISAFGFRKG